MNVDSIKACVERYKVDGRTGMVMPLDVVQAMLAYADAVGAPSLSPGQKQLALLTHLVFRLTYSIDGNQLCVMLDDFINLQESPSVFLEIGSDMATTIVGSGFEALTVGELLYIYGALVPHPGTQVSGQSLPPYKGSLHESIDNEQVAH